MKVHTFAALLLMTLFLVACSDDEGWIVIQNDIDSPLVSVSIDACGTGPGPNLLQGGQIASGDDESFRVSFGCYDVRAVTADDRFANWQVNVGRSDRRIVLFTQSIE